MNVVMPDTTVQFTLPRESFENIMRGAVVMGLPEIVVCCYGTAIELEARNMKVKKSSDRYRHVGLAGNTKGGEELEFVFKLENLHLIPMDYAVTISDAGIAKFVGIDPGDVCEEITYWVATERKR